MTIMEGRASGLTSRASADFLIGQRMTGEGVALADTLSGQYAERAYRGNLHSFAVAAVTLPVNANNLVSVMGIYNPPGSGKLLELVTFTAQNVVAATVINGIGLYFSTVALSALATFTTPGTAYNRRLADASSTVARVYTAVTHSGTPVLAALLGGWGAVTNAGNGPIRHLFEGTVMIPPGVLASVAGTTGANTASGVTMNLVWADVPL